MKMSEAFSRDSDFQLFVKKAPQNCTDIFGAYGIGCEIDIQRIGSLVGRIAWPKSLFFAFVYGKIINKEKEAIFYIRDVLLAFFLVFIAPGFRERFVFELHSLGKFPHFMYSRVFREARGIVSTNNGKKEELVSRYKISEEKIFVAPNGFDPVLFADVEPRENVRRKLGFKDAEKVVLYAGSTQAWKGIDMIKKLAKEFSDVTFVIVGGDSSSRDGNVISIQAQEHKIIPSYLCAADLLIAPYDLSDKRVARLFSPIKVIEYMASGTPMIATDAPSIREFVGEGGALLVSPYSYNAFHDALSFALENDGKMRQNASRSLERSKQYSWNARAESIVSFIKSKS
ncbi:MAG: glycosyltransferase family 4 protein [bacterium]|nr:glycosyltransferase family 4 protein [bacterium]